VLHTGPARGAERRRLESLLALDPRRAARRLLGCTLVRAQGRRVVTARIVETEAYFAKGDRAAHAWHGRTARTEPLWGPAGTWYVYLIYGMHHCLNVAVQREGQPGCVLVRAAEIASRPANEARGPGRLTRALRIDRALSGASAFHPTSALWLREGDPVSPGVSCRIGVRHAADRPLRFFDPESRAVSGPRLTPRTPRA
jgi:DNA-3-methyladenine glycosylase